MLIISENELYHTDSCEDIIEHHGVKGMKWGQRAARKVGAFVKASARAKYNEYRHPILSSRAARESFKRSRGGTFMGTTRSLDFQNRYVKDMVAAKKQYKQDKRKALGKHDEGDDKIFNKYGHEAYFSKRNKQGGETRKAYRERQRGAQQKMSMAYKDLNARYKKDIIDAKAKRQKAAVVAGGKY